VKRFERYIVFFVLLVIFISGTSFFLRSEGPGLDTHPRPETGGQPALSYPLPRTRPDKAYRLDEIAVHSVSSVSKEEFRAVWVATVMNLDFPSRQGLSAAAMKQEIDAIVARCVELRLNAIIFQVRPTGDALYESDIFPWSHWLSGTQGIGVPNFDPLAYIIEECHANSLELHAWLNPYRVIHTQTNSSDPNTLSQNNPVRQRPELAIGWSSSNGRSGLFLDPGLPEARQLIIDGITEIIEKYDVDGIHIDDYFYPGANFNDASSFALYGNGMELSDWRRENVNVLIQGIQAAIREKNQTLGKNVRWGISPTAIWKNGSSDPDGVPSTRGQESYHELYADTRRWVMEEWVDYICPQIYWYIGYEIADFESILNWWVDLCKEHDVDLYIGHAAYREDQGDQPPNWEGELGRQLNLAASSNVVKGSVFYRFHSLKGALGDSIRDFYIRKGFISLLRQLVYIVEMLTIGTPAKDATITATAADAPGYTITGASVPDKTLYMNGAEVENRTNEGFFSVYVPLEEGENIFTFSQEGQADIVRKITRNPPAPSSGETTQSSAPTVSQIKKPTYATIVSDSSWVYPTYSTSGGSDWMMSRGQQDRIVAESSNGYVKLSCGMWINRNDVAVQTEHAIAENTLKNGEYQVGTDYDMIVWQSDVFTAVYATYDGQALTINYGMHHEAPPLTLPGDLSETVFSSVSSGKNGDTPFSAFTIRGDAKFEGCHVEYDNGEFRLCLKKRKTVAEGDKPLAGITIVLDAGHGGDSSGALGPLGIKMPEKSLTLINARKLMQQLTQLGATVHMTRAADTNPSLQRRVDLSWSVKPDLFISLHINSVAETTNSEKTRGFTVWYMNHTSENFAQTVLDVMYHIIPDTNRHRNINQGNLFVCRPQWAPSILLEAGFIVNTGDFVWLLDPVRQDKMAGATVDAILDYFAPDQ